MSDLKLSIKLTTEGGNVVVREINGVNQAANAATAGLNEAGNAGERAGRQLADAGTGGVAGLTQHMTMLRSTLGLLVGGFSAMKMVDSADSWGQMAARIRQATLSASEYNYVQARMVESAGETFRSITETREGFIRMSPILRDMNYGLEQSIDIVDSFSALLVTNAASADRAGSALAALSKSIQTNRVDSDAWQTIFGVMPSILNNLTASTGKTATEIRELGITGKLSINDLTDALLKNREANLEAVRGMPTAVQDALVNFRSAFENYIGWQNEAKGVTAGVAEVVVSLTKHIDLLAAGIGGVAVGAMALYISKSAVALNSMRLERAARIAQAQATLQSALADQRKTQQLVFLAQQEAIAARGTAVQTQMSIQLAQARAAEAAATHRLAAAQAAQVTIGRSLLGVLGGPAGIALTAGLVATSFFAMRSGADQAAEGSSKLFTETERLRTELERMTAAQAQKYLQDMSSTYKDAQFDVMKYSAQIETLNRNIAMHPGSQKMEVWKASLIDAKAELDTAKQALEEYNEQQRILNEHIDKQASGTKGNGGSTATNKELEKSLLDLYNAHLLNAQAIDAHGRALTGVDFELFKAQFKAAEKAPEDLAAALKKLYEEKRNADANLSADQFLEQIREEIRLTEVKLTLGQAEYELQKQLAGFAHADTSRLAAIREEVALLQQKEALTNIDKVLTDLQAETALLQIRLEQGLEEYEVQKKLFLLKGGDPAHIAAIESQVRAQQALNEQIAQSEAVSSGAFTEMLDNMTALGSAGDAVGDVLIQTFGRVAQQLTAMTKAQDDYRKNLEKLQKEREKASKMDKTSEAYQKKMTELQQHEGRLQRENFQNQMGQYAALSGTMSQFFGEQSREREALHKMEMAFSAVEMAMAIQKAAQNALVAITSQGEGDPYTAFARIAAMAALMAGLGVFSGSASGSAPTAAQRQEVQGTGSVLGDPTAKSNSIGNVFERIEELELDQYHELRAINTSIKALNAGIAKLAINLVSSYGRFDEAAYTGPLGKMSNSSTNGFFASLGDGVGKFGDGLTGIVGGLIDDIVGSFSTTKRKLTDSGISFDAQSIGDILATGIVDASYYSVIETTKKKAWGLSKKKSSATDYADLDNALLEEFGRVFTHIGTSVNGAVDVLGLDLERELKNYVINLPHLSLKDLSGDDIEKELNAVFSNQSDLMVQWLVPAMGQYQKMGEGLYETLIRVAQEQAIVNAQLDTLGLQLASLGDVTAETRIAVSQSLVELMGGIEQFRDLTGEYFDGFYSDAEKFANLSGSVNTAFADLGLTLPGSAAGIRDIVGAIDLTTDSGQQLFATLMQLVPSLREYYDVLEQRAEFEKGLQRELESLDMSGFEQSLLQLQDWYNEQIRIAESLGAETVFIERLYARKRAETVDSELARINDEHARSLETLNNQYNQLYSAIDNASRGVADAILNIKRQASGWNEVSYQQGQIKNLNGQIGVGSTSEQITAIQQMQQAITARYNAEMARNKQMADASQQRYQTELAAVNAIRSAALQLLTAADAMLLSNMSPELLGSQLTEAKSQFDKLTAAARKGDASAMQQLQGVGSSYLDIAKEFYAQGSDEYSAIFDEIQNIYRSIGAAAPAEPRAPASTISYQQSDSRVQQSALRELEALQEKLEELQEKEKAEQEIAAAALEAEQRKARDDALEAQNKHIEATLKTGEDIVAAIATQTKATDAVITELRQQSSAAKADTETLRSELARTRTELARTQDLVWGGRGRAI